MHTSNSVKEALDELSKNWKIDPKLYDLQVGLRDDIADSTLTISGVIFHIPVLTNDGLFVLWKCLWPDCHNCCERQGRLPLTKDDIAVLTKKLGYLSKAEFVRNETGISSWQEQEPFGNIITTLSMISLKRKKDEKEEEDGKPLRCRFLDDKGYCGIHPDKPGVCWLYPFASWLESDKHGKPVVHTTFQFTGDSPGYHLEKNLDSVMPVLQEYAPKIYSYNMSVQRTTRENYGFINFVDSK
ncbi:MAG: zinc/iron-chelating domain-containing protein [Nitrososphaera sp.]|nr:zinc/iron-chelating domain-containing protein [Nitrososphaera sp.]